PVLDAAVDLMRRIKADFVYEIGATTASTTPPMSFALRRGVCQDCPLLNMRVSGRKSRIFGMRANRRLTAGDGTKPTAIWGRPAAVRRTGGPSAWCCDAF